MMKRALAKGKWGLIGALSVALGGCEGAPRGTVTNVTTNSPSNVVWVVGDGFGVGAWTLTREAARSRGGLQSLDSSRAVGFVDPHASDERVTDSAAAATAWSTGVLAPRFGVGVPDSARRVALLFEDLRRLGRPHGFVTTTRVTHATPAPFYARVGHRDEEDSIAAQLVLAMPDVVIGGGLQHFLPQGQGGTRSDSRDLTREPSARGFEVLRSWRTPLPAEKPVLVLLSASHFPHELDRRGEPDLADLCVAAIRRLEVRGKPWFLLVEEGQIDRAAHDHDAAGIAANGKRLDRALAAILGNVDLKKTLVVVLGDHATSSPSILEGAHPESLEIATASVEAMAARIFADGPWTGTPRGLETHAVPILDEGCRHTGLYAEDLDDLLSMKTAHDRTTALGGILSRRFGIAFLPLEDHVRSTGVHGHTGELVPVRAFGPRASEVSGVHDHAALGRWLRDVLGVSSASAPALGEPPGVRGPATAPGPAAIDSTISPT